MSENESTVSLSWKYDNDAEGFNVTIKSDTSYPVLPGQSTSTKNITLKLAPGAIYVIEVSIIIYISMR